MKTVIISVSLVPTDLQLGIRYFMIGLEKRSFLKAPHLCTMFRQIILISVLENMIPTVLNKRGNKCSMVPMRVVSTS